MTYTKTGCHIFLEPYNEYAYGDAFEIEPILAKDAALWQQLSYEGHIDKIHNIAYFNLMARSHEPINGLEEIHYIVHDWDNWVNPDGPQTDAIMRLHNSILITNNFTRETRKI